MEHWKLENWCFEAVEKIKYRPDRDAVYTELLQHMDDRCESFMAQGMCKEDAVIKTVEAMGDPSELADQLAAIHRPFWGFAYSITKWLLRIIAVIMVISIGVRIVDIINAPRGKRDDSLYTRPTVSTLTHFLYAEPNCSDSSDGYIFTVTRAALHRHISDVQETSGEPFAHLYIELKVTNTNLWVGDCQAISAFWGTDNRGRFYARNLNNHPATGYLSCYYSYEDAFTQYYNFELIIYQPEECTWFELHYDRDGRDIVLRINLTGGDGV